LLRVHPWIFSKAVYRDLLSEYLPIGVISQQPREFADYIKQKQKQSISVDIVTDLLSLICDEESSSYHIISYQENLQCERPMRDMQTDRPATSSVTTYKTAAARGESSRAGKNLVMPELQRRTQVHNNVLNNDKSILDTVKTSVNAGKPIV